MGWHQILEQKVMPSSISESRVQLPKSDCKCISDGVLSSSNTEKTRSLDGSACLLALSLPQRRKGRAYVR